MNKYLINPNSDSAREVIAKNFKIHGDFFFFYDLNNEVISIQKAEYIDRVDLIG